MNRATCIVSLAALSDLMGLSTSTNIVTVSASDDTDTVLITLEGMDIPENTEKVKLIYERTVGIGGTSVIKCPTIRPAK